MLKQTIEKNGLDNFIKFTKNVRSKDGEGVILRTVHSSKGLEADNVYIVGLNDNKFPHRGMMDARETPPEFEHLFGKPIEEELKAINQSGNYQIQVKPKALSCYSGPVSVEVFIQEKALEVNFDFAVEGTGIKDDSGGGIFPDDVIQFENLSDTRAVKWGGHLS